MGCTSVKRTEQVLEAMEWYFGQRHVRDITLVDDDNGSTATNYFELNTIDENYTEKKFVVWFNEGLGAAPTVAADQTLIEVAYDRGDAAAVLAGLTAAAIETAADVFADVTGAAIKVENKFLGKITVESYANAADFTMEICELGFGGEIGAIAQGGGSLSSEQSLEDILSDQTGDVVLDQILKGSTVSLDMTLAEMTTERWQNLVGEGFGDIHDALGQKLTGFGTSKLYNSSFDFAGMLIGHPIRKVYSDRTADIVIWKCVGNLNSLNFSGSDIQGGEFSFQALKDDSKPESINLFARGDHSLV